MIAGDWALTAGTTATEESGALLVGDAYQQALAAFRIALDALAQAGVGITQVVRTRMYVRHRPDQPAVGRAHSEVFGDILPVATMVQVSGLADPFHLVEVELEAYLG